jgi:hypothetical protein
MQAGYTESASIALESVESLVSVPDEREAHLSFLLLWHGASQRTVNDGRIFLRNLVDGEVRHVDVRAEFRFERRTDIAELLPDHSPKKGVILDLRRTFALATFATNTILGVAQEAITWLVNVS